MTTVTAKKVLLKDEFGNPLIPYTEQKTSLHIGQIISMNCSGSYVPDGTLPCDGAEYSKAQFSDLWENYLTGEEKTVAVPADFLDLTGLNVSEDGEVTGFNSSNYLKFNINEDGKTTKIEYTISMTDVITEQTLIDIGEGLATDTLFVYNGSLIYQNTNKVNTPICSVEASVKYKLVFQWSNDTSLYTLTVSQDGTTLGSVTTNYLPMDYSGYILRDFGYSFTSGTLYLLDSQAVASPNWYKFATEKTVLDSLLNTCTYSDYEADIATYGQCAKFAVDVENETFRVPLIKDGAVIQQALSNVELGKVYNAGLPNVEASILYDTSLDSDNQFLTEGTSQFTADGALYVKNTRTAKGIGNSSTTFKDAPADLSLDLSRSNSIYGSSDTVQMNAVALRYFVVVANGQTNQSMMDWSAWASSLQGKMNADHSNDPYPYIKEIVTSGTDGYIVYSNNLCEQWGFVSNVGTSATINLYKEYSDIYYNKTLGATTNSANDTAGVTAVTVLQNTTETSTTTTSFNISSVSDTSIYWRTIGRLK